VVRVIDTLARTRRERISSGDIDPTRCDQGKQHRLLLPSGPKIGGKGLAVDSDVDTLMSFVRSYLDSLFRQSPSLAMYRLPAGS